METKIKMLSACLYLKDLTMTQTGIHSLFIHKIFEILNFLIYTKKSGFEDTL